MSITFKESVAELREDYLNSVREQQEPEAIEEKYNAYMDAFAKDMKEQVITEARQSTLDGEIQLKRNHNVLTSEERKFFKNLTDADLDTYKEDLLLPESTVIRVMEDMQTQRPLLSKIRFNVAGIKTRMIVGDPNGAAIWGEIFGKIQGQISANFKEVSFAQNKLTAFAIVPKDLIEFGYEWVERYVRLQLAEAIGAKLEEGIVVGKGPTANEPVGLTREFDYDDNGLVSSVVEKEVEGQLTFADAETTAKELAQLMAALSVKENGKRINVAGKVTLLVNPAEQYLIQANYTVQNVNGQWITSLPYNLDLIASEFVEPGKVVAFVGSRYHAIYTGAVSIRSYDQTLALEDANVYIAKQFAHGLPDDKNTAKVYDLAIAEAGDLEGI